MKRKLTDAFIKDAKNKGENSEQDLRLVEETTEKFINNVNLIGSMLSHLFPDIKALDADETLTYLHSTVSNRRVEVKTIHCVIFAIIFLMKAALRQAENPNLVTSICVSLRF